MGGQAAPGPVPPGPSGPSVPPATAVRLAAGAMRVFDTIDAARAQVARTSAALAEVDAAGADAAWGESTSAAVERAAELLATARRHAERAARTVEGTFPAESGPAAWPHDAPPSSPPSPAGGVS
jgi:hypothetical protein